MAYNRKPQSPNDFIVLDTETGGLSSNKNPVTEIALISLDGGDLKKISEYQSLIGPYDEELVYEQKALDVTGITLEMLEEEGMGIREVAEAVLHQFEIANVRKEKSPGLRPILVGHNMPFDISQLHHLMIWGLKGTKLDPHKELERVLHGRIDHFGHFQPSYMDTWSIGKTWFQGDGELMDYKLATLVEKLGVDINNAHRAMNDVVSTAEVLRVYINNLRAGYVQNHQGGRAGFTFQI